MVQQPILQQRIQRFRSGAYVWLASLMAVLAGNATPPLLPWLAVVLLPGMPWVLRGVEQLLGVAGDDAENLVTPLLIGWFGLPLLPGVAVIGATLLLDEFFAALSELSRSYRGNLHKFLGDGALISFGESRSEGRRNDAAACVTMLGQLAWLVERLNAAARCRSIDAVLAVRAGVASGYCTVGDFGADERIEYTMIGAPVNLASRLEGLAAPGEIWAAQTTRDLVGAERFEVLGTFAVKGFDDPVVVHRLRVTASVDAGGSAI